LGYKSIPGQTIPTIGVNVYHREFRKLIGTRRETTSEPEVARPDSKLEVLVEKTTLEVEFDGSVEEIEGQVDVGVCQGARVLDLPHDEDS